MYASYPIFNCPNHAWGIRRIHCLHSVVKTYTRLTLPFIYLSKYFPKLYDRSCLWVITIRDIVIKV